MNTLEFNYLVSYLKEKGVRFAVKTNFENGVKSIIGVKVTKEGKFFKANGKVISRNFAGYFV